MTPSRDAAPVIHIGYPKTATTLLQSRVFAPHPSLAQRTILDARHDADLRHAFRVLLETDEAVFHDHEDVLRQTLFTAPPGQVAVVSHEHLDLGAHWRLGQNWTPAWDRPTLSHGYVGRQRIMERLARLAPEAHILVTLREPVALLESLYLQLCQNRKFTMSYTAFLQDAWESRAYSSILAGLELDALTRTLTAIFGRERVIILPYEDLTANRARYVGTLADALGLPPDDVDKALTTEAVNPRMRANRHRLQTLRKRIPGGHVLAKAVPGGLKRALFATGAPQTLTTDAAWRDALNGYFAPGTRRLAETFNLPLADLGYPT